MHTKFVNLDIENPQAVSLEELAADIVSAVPVADIVKANYGGIWAHLPADDEINAGMAGNVAGKIMETYIVEPQGTFIETLMATLGGSIPPAELAERMPEAMECLEEAITACLKKHCLQSYTYRG